MTGARRGKKEGRNSIRGVGARGEEGGGIGLINECSNINHIVLQFKVVSYIIQKTFIPTVNCSFFTWQFYSRMCVMSLCMCDAILSIFLIPPNITYFTQT